MKENEVYKLLDKYGIKRAEFKIIGINETLNFEVFPCVLKINSDKISHKTDVGGVITNITTKEELKKAKIQILKSIKNNKILLDNNDKFIIEEQLSGVELFIGGINDPVFSKILVFGKGGTFIEIEKDICYIDIKATKKEILTSINKTKISKIFPKFRGKKYDINEIINVIKKFQNFFEKEDISEFDINPLIYTDKGLFAIDARIKTKNINKYIHYKKNISLFENKKVVILGATDKKEKVGYAISKNSLKSKSKIYFVNPTLKKLFNKKVYSNVEELPEIDTSVIAIPPKFVVENIKLLIKKGCKNFIIISAGFKEIGNDEVQNKLKELAIKYNINIVGPNCLGIYNNEFKLNLTFAKSKIYEGEIGLISQSGAVLTAIMDKASHYKIGFSHIISMGNMADFNFANAIDELNKQKNCKVISIYAEGLQFGKAFLEAIRNSKKPILLFKAGQSDEAKKAAFSHTGNIAGNYEMIIELAETAGAIIKHSAESLIFSSKYYDVKKILIVTNAGGPGTILTDLIAKQNKKLLKIDKKTMKQLDLVLPNTWSHNNPVDIIGDATPKRYKDTLEIVKNKLIFVIVTPQFMTNSENIAKILLNYDNVIPIMMGKNSFLKAGEIFDKNDKLYFNSLEEATKII